MTERTNKGSTKAKNILASGLLCGVAIFVASYGALLLGIRLVPSFFVEYINPIFNSGGERDVLFYLHPFVLGMALSVFWHKFKAAYTGHALTKGLAFGASYALIALVPILWITFSAMDVSGAMVLSWLAYGLFQATVGGIVLAFVGAA